MSTVNSLIIEEIERRELNFRFRCSGFIDTHAEPAFAIFNDIPQGASIELDFTRVERVNSMGLSLLLKLFETFERNNIEISVSHLNRMIGMLFKITGLGRFVQGVADDISGTRLITPKAPETQPASEPASDMAQEAGRADKWNFTANLQTGAQLSGWFLLNTHLQRRLQKVIHFEPTRDHTQNMPDLVFTTPFATCALIKKGFTPLVRPEGEADEVIIACHAEDTRALSHFHNANVATASADSFVYLLGRFLCDEQGLASNQFNFLFSGNEIKGLQMVLRKQAELWLVLKKTYEGLSSLSRKQLRVLDTSDTQFAFHSFSIAPHLQADCDPLMQVLLAMHDDQQGIKILNDLQIRSWCKPEPGELAMLQQVYRRYVET